MGSNCNCIASLCKNDLSLSLLVFTSSASMSVHTITSSYSMCCSCVMPPLMVCEVGPSHNGLFCHAVSLSDMPAAAFPSQPVFSLGLSELPSAGQTGVTVALTCLCRTVTLIRTPQDRAGVRTPALVTGLRDLSHDTAQGNC